MPFKSLKDAESELILLAQNGSNKAFDKLINGYHDGLRNEATKLVKNRNIADESLQKTLIKAHSNIKRFNGNCKIFTWLTEILKNTINDELRREQRRQKKEVLIDDGNEEKLLKVFSFVSPRSLLEDKELVTYLDQCICSLENNQRRIIRLRMDQKKHSEIAKIMKISVSNAKVIACRARKELKKLLEDSEFCHCLVT